MGLVQALAIVPGISRSGMTITAGIVMKGDRADIAAFSFLWLFRLFLEPYS